MYEITDKEKRELDERDGFLGEVKWTEKELKEMTDMKKPPLEIKRIKFIKNE